MVPGGWSSLYRNLLNRAGDFTFPVGDPATASCIGEGPKLGLAVMLPGGAGVHGKQPKIVSVDHNKLGGMAHLKALSMGKRNHVPQRSEYAPHGNEVSWGRLHQDPSSRGHCLWGNQPQIVVDSRKGSLEGTNSNSISGQKSSRFPEVIRELSLD